MKQAQECTEADKRSRRRIPWWDVLVAVGLLLVGLVACFVVRACSPRGTWVEVSVDGQAVGQYSLLTDGEYSLNGGTNTLVIRGGEARLVRSQCPDHRCERGAIGRCGESITCLPNRVQVRVMGDTDRSPDFVSG